MSDKQKKPDSIMVKTTTVYCDGGDVHLGHPMEFLHIDGRTNDVTCPYCGRHFVLEKTA